MRLLPPTTILAYHRVAAPVWDPYDLCVTPEHFASHIQVLSRRARITELGEIDKWSRRPRVIITFDDGYADNLHTALPLAERFELPLTVFVCSGQLGSTFWQERLSALMSGRDEPEVHFCLDVEPGRITVHLRGHDRWARAMRAVHERLRNLDPLEIQSALEALEAALGTGGSTDRPRALTQDELVELSGHPLVTIGAHTADHMQLAGKPALAQLETICKSKVDLEGLTNGPVHHFAYPYGGRDDFDDASVDAVRQSGFATACTMIDGHVAGFADRFRLPRRFVRDWEHDEFVERLHRWGID